jgi:hypothetical protein
MLGVTGYQTPNIDRIAREAAARGNEDIAACYELPNGRRAHDRVAGSRHRAQPVAAGLSPFPAAVRSERSRLLAARRWHAQRGVDETARTSVGFITGGMLALLAFLLAISLSIADRRYEDRRAVVLAQANAIGTAWLRAGAQDTEAGRTLQRLLKDYAEVRIQAAGPIETPAPVLERTAALQSEIWTIAGTIARTAPTAVSAQLLASLNEVFDLAVSERQAFRSRVPRHLLRLLLWASLLAIAGLGSHLGMLGSRQFVMSTLLILMWTSSMVLIVDINRSGQGFIEVSADPLIWTLEQMRSPAR